MRRDALQALGWSFGTTAVLVATVIWLMSVADHTDDCAAAVARDREPLRTVGADLEPILGEAEAEPYCDDSGGLPVELSFADPPADFSVADAQRQLAARGWEGSPPDDEGIVLYGATIDGQAFTLILDTADVHEVAALARAPRSAFS